MNSNFLYIFLLVSTEIAFCFGISPDLLKDKEHSIVQNGQDITEAHAGLVKRSPAFKRLPGWSVYYGKRSADTQTDSNDSSENEAERLLSDISNEIIENPENDRDEKIKDILGYENWMQNQERNPDLFGDMDPSDPVNKRLQAWMSGYGKRDNEYDESYVSDESAENENEDDAINAAKRSGMDDEYVKKSPAWFSGYGKRSAWFTGYGKRGAWFAGYGRRSPAWFSGYGKRSPAWFSGYGKRSPAWFSGYGKRSPAWFSGYGKRSPAWFSGYGKRSPAWFSGYGKRSPAWFSGYGKRSAWFTGYGKRSPAWFSGYGKRSPAWFTGYGKRLPAWFSSYGKRSSENERRSPAWFSGYGKRDGWASGYGKRAGDEDESNTGAMNALSSNALNSLMKEVNNLDSSDTLADDWQTPDNKEQTWSNVYER